eukprot:scaffold44766_cov64-Phaeocystis_antarctica.AAC.7
MDRKTKKTSEVREIGARTNTERHGGVAAVRARRRCTSRPVVSHHDDLPGRTPTSRATGLCLSARHREPCARLDLEERDDGLERLLGLYYLLLAEEEVLADLLLATAGVVLAKRGPVRAGVSPRQCQARQQR